MRSRLKISPLLLEFIFVALLPACGKQYYDGNPAPEGGDSASSPDITSDSFGNSDADSDQSGTDLTTDAPDSASEVPDETDTEKNTDTDDTPSDPKDSDPSDAGDTEPLSTDTTEPETDTDMDTESADSDPIDTETGDTETYVDTDEHLDSDAVPANVPKVEIEIDDAGKAQLESDPFNGPKVPGGFIDASGRHYEVELNYRGAYALERLIDSGKMQRNWKVKFPKTDKYRNRREWNFNYEPSVRQKLAYDLLKFAGVKMPSPRHVRLIVNGEPQGVYLEWEDPDSKDWLWDRFGDDEGDLYKAAYDVPDEPKYFADMTYLGDADEDYFLHYRKKTNNDRLPDDYSILRGFLYDLNYTADDEFVDWMQASFNWESFITYLAVSNFMSNWDGYPQRPKNFWLYNNPTTDKWTFIPWDLDATFELYMDGLNQMGTDASIFYQFDEFEPYELQEGESEDRPLVRRMMAYPKFRDAYIARYKELMSGVLDADYIKDRATRLTELVVGVAGDEDKYTAQDAEGEILEFAARRFENVQGQLSAY